MVQRERGACAKQRCGNISKLRTAKASSEVFQRLYRFPQRAVRAAERGSAVCMSCTNALKYGLSFTGASPPLPTVRQLCAPSHCVARVRPRLSLRREQRAHNVSHLKVVLRRTEHASCMQERAASIDDDVDVGARRKLLAMSNRFIKWRPLMAFIHDDVRHFGLYQQPEAFL